MNLQSNELKSKFDYSIIQKYQVSDVDCENLALKAKLAGIDTVVVCPSSLPAVVRMIADTDIKIAVAISYPSGAYLVKSKTEEIEGLFETGQRFDEIYAVLAVGRFLSGYENEAREEVNALIKAANGKTVKLVIEAGVMSFDQKKKICDIASQAGVEYIVASTGFAPYDVPFPTTDDIRQLARAAEGRLKIIACGNIADKRKAAEMLEAGADRVCTSHAFEIMMD